MSEYNFDINSFDSDYFRQCFLASLWDCNHGTVIGYETRADHMESHTLFYALTLHKIRVSGVGMKEHTKAAAESLAKSAIYLADVYKISETVRSKLQPVDGKEQMIMRISCQFSIGNQEELKNDVNQTLFSL